MGRMATFVLTLLCTQIFRGLIVVYSACKPILISQFDFSETYLGTIDLVTFLLRSFSTIYLILRPPSRPNLIYFLSTVLQLVGLIIFCLIEYIDFQQKLIAMIGMSIFGIARGTLTIPFVLLLAEFSVQRDAKQIAVWSGTQSVGIAVGFAYSQIFLQFIKLQWHFTLIIFSVLYCIVSGLMLKFVDETNVDKFGDHSFCERVTLIKESFMRFAHNSANKILTMEAVIVENVGFTTNSWAPVFITNVGLQRFNKLIPMAFTLFLVIGPILISILSGDRKQWRKFLIASYIIIQTLAFAWLILLGGDSSQIPQYFVSFAISGITQGGLMGWVAGSQILEHIRGDHTDRYCVLSIIKTLRQIFSAFTLQIFGVLMDINNSYFVYLSVGIGVLILVLNVSRMYLQYKQESEQREKNAGNSMMEEMQ